MFIVTRTNLRDGVQTGQLSETVEISGIATMILMNEARDLIDAGFAVLSQTGEFPVTETVWTDRRRRTVVLSVRPA